MAYDSVILSNWKAPPVGLDLTRAIAKERGETMGTSRPAGRHLLVSDWCVHSPGDGDHPASACLPGSLRREESLALEVGIWLSLTGKIIGFAWCACVMK